MQGLLEKFEYAEVIFGCEDIVHNNVAAIMAVEAKMVELITKRWYLLPFVILHHTFPFAI